MQHYYEDRKKPNHYLPPGTHEVIVRAIWNKTSSSGNQMLQVELLHEKTGAVVIDYLVKTEQAAWKLDEFVRALDLIPPKGEPVDFGANLLWELRGRSVRVRVGNEPYNGDLRTKVHSYLAIENPAPAQKPF